MPKAQLSRFHECIAARMGSCVRCGRSGFQSRRDEFFAIWEKKTQILSRIGQVVRHQGESRPHFVVCDKATHLKGPCNGQFPVRLPWRR
jgi:hypothetical protein